MTISMRTTSRTSSSLTEPSGSQRKELIPIELDIIHTGDCLEILKTLPDDSVHCCVTSPPYYALRDYGMEAQIGRETTPKEYISRHQPVSRRAKASIHGMPIISFGLQPSTMLLRATA